MNKRICHLVAWLLCIITSVMVSQPAMAQQRAKSVVILKFDTFDVDTEVMDLFYRQVNDAVDTHPNKRVADGGELTMSEMVLMGGCDSPTPECLTSVKGMLDLEADQLLFGSVQHSEDIHLFTLKLFDFETGQYEAVLEDQTVQGRGDNLEAAIGGLVDSLLYGDVGELDILARGADDVTVYVDGERIGKAPLSLKNLPLGEHVVTARTPDGQERTQRVVLTRSSPSRLAFSFGPVDIDGSPAPQKGLVGAGWTSVGLGLVGIAVGAQQRIALANLEDDATQTYGDRASISSQEAEDVRSDVSDRQAQMDATLTRSNVGFIAGAALIATGGALLYMGYGVGTETDATAQRDDRRIQWSFFPTRRACVPASLL